MLNATELIVPERFDILAKVLFARHRVLQTKCLFFELLYREHINVFNGGWEYPGTKTSTNEFVRSFGQLIESIKKEGFQSGCEVPINSHNLPINGAHRIAACYVLGIPVPINTKTHYSTKSPRYNYAFFRTHRMHVSTGLNQVFSDRMALEFCKIHKDTRIITM